MYSLDTKSPKIHGLIEVLEKELHDGRESITYPAIAYDSFWISSLSLEKNSTTSSYLDSKNIKKSFKDIIIETAESFDNGISGKIQLNETGDRIGENYDFWSVSKDTEKNHYVWKTENTLIGQNH